MCAWDADISSVSAEFTLWWNAVVFAVFHLSSCLDIRGEILYRESGEVLEQLPREAVDAPSLEVFKARLDGALGSLV